MRIVKINNYKNYLNKSNNTTCNNLNRQSNYNNCTGLVHNNDCDNYNRISFTNSKKEVNSTSQTTKNLIMLYKTNDEGFSEYLTRLDDKSLVQQINSIIATEEVIPFSKMSLEQIQIYLDSSGKDGISKIKKAKDKGNNNIFYKCSYEQLQLIMPKLSKKEAARLILNKNRIGSNAIHSSLIDEDKLRMLCDILDKGQVKKCVSLENGYNLSALKNFPVENLEIMLEGLSNKEVANICLSKKYRNNNNIFHRMQSDRTELLCKHLDREDIKKLCIMQNQDGDTPLHTLKRKPIEVILKYLSSDDIKEICQIKNKLSQTPLDCQDEKVVNILRRAMRNCG